MKCNMGHSIPNRQIDWHMIFQVMFKVISAGRKWLIMASARFVTLGDYPFNLHTIFKF